MNRFLAVLGLIVLAAGPAVAEGGKYVKQGHEGKAYGGQAYGGHGGGVIRAECSVEVFASVNSLDRPSEAFVQAIRASIGPRASRAEAYILGEAYCRHPERLRSRGVAEAALQRDIVDMRRR